MPLMASAGVCSAPEVATPIAVANAAAPATPEATAAIRFTACCDRSGLIAGKREAASRAAGPDIASQSEEVIMSGLPLSQENEMCHGRRSRRA